MMLCRMDFWLYGKVVALHLENSTAKAYLCNQGGTVSPFLSRLACQILSLTNKHSITVIPAPIATHLSVGTIYLSWGQLLWSGIFFLTLLRQLFAFGVYHRWICLHPPMPLNVSIITPWKLPLPLGATS